MPFSAPRPRASSGAAADRSGATASPGPARHRTGLWLAGTVALAVLAASGAGWAVLNGVGRSIDRVDAFAGADDRPEDDGGTTILVVGTDDRDGIPEATLKNLLHAGGEGCHCTDVMMLVQLARDGGRASVVSIPRDSYVTIPAHRDPATRRQVPASMGKINAAYGMGGAPLAVRTVEQATGLRIDHYLQANFLGFVATVDALGGVDVCTAKPLKDEFAGLELPAGRTRLDGAGALRYVRARHVDGSSDLGRMHRQQRLLAQLLRRATDTGTLLSPGRLSRMVDILLSSVKVDKGLSAEELLALATRLKDLSAANTDFATVPLAVVDHQVSGWGSTVLWDQRAAKALFDAVREGRPLTGHSETAAGPSPAPPSSPGAAASASVPSVSAVPTASASASAASAPAALSVPPGHIRIQVLNGAGVLGLGARVDGDLRKLGFATTGTPANTEGGGSVARTVVKYDPRWDESVRTVAAALPTARLVRVPGLGATLQVIAGNDYLGVTALPSPTEVTTPEPSPSPAASHAGGPVPEVSATTGSEIGCR
ncbi:LCP family protein [Kitasatospora cystarginea]|uniref:LCP family protein n=1 Tax=Kitasatospora cystarginea TaxID=58350 RepID=A0ABN3ECP2_9ACTN